ncbi:hypothetical protein AAG906_022083 [Vitis piasezkii]
MITTQYQSNIQVIRTDNGGEFINQDLKRYLNLHGIVHQTTCPYTPQQNGGEAITVAAYLINCIPSRENKDEVQTLHHPLDNLDFIRGDNLETSGEYPSDDNTMDNGRSVRVRLVMVHNFLRMRIRPLKKNSTWEVVDLPEGKIPIGCRMHFCMEISMKKCIWSCPLAVINKPKHNKEQITTLIVYVDDMIVTRKDFEERKTLQEHLAHEFEMKNLGELKYFLEIKKIKLCVHSNQVPANKEHYQRLIGRLMYLAHTQSDLAYALSVVSQFMHPPSEEHMNVVIRILRYLKSSPRKGILFTK